MDDLPTPDELGEKLKAGEITKEEAVEVMSQRARRDGLAGLYGPPMSEEAKRVEAKGTRKLGTLVFFLIIMALVTLYALMQMLG